jgi:Fe2+ transport system protein B
VLAGVQAKGLSAASEGGLVSQQTGPYGLLLAIALFWALLSACAATVSVEFELRRSAWGWTASFVMSSVVAAYSFWRLP